MNINKELKSFYSHAAENPDGWGIFLRDAEETLFDKEDRRADRSRRLKSLLSRDITATDAIAHIRLATIGYDEIENTHPFRGYDLSGREWIFAHNGTIFESDLLTKYTYEQDGDTDSERIFLYIMDRIKEATVRKQGALDENERFKILEEITAALSPKNKLNLLIYDSEVLYVHTNFKDSLYMREKDGGICFATRPLSDENWEHVPFMRLCSFKEGRMLKTGEYHGHEYIPDECSIRALYLAYSGL